MKKKLTTLLTVSVCLAAYFVMSAGGDEREIDALRAKAEQLLREAKEHAAQGQADEARKIVAIAAALRAEADELAEHRERGARKEPERGGQPEPQHDGHAQIEHLRQAAQHLHAAGLHEPAEEFMRDADRRQHELERNREGQHDEGLQRHVEELAKRVVELHERLERMERAIQELTDRGNPPAP